MQERVQEVGADLEALDAQAALAEGRHEADRDRGLAHPGLHPPDHNHLAAPHLGFNSSLRARFLSVRHLSPRSLFRCDASVPAVVRRFRRRP